MLKTEERFALLKFERVIRIGDKTSKITPDLQCLISGWLNKARVLSVSLIIFGGAVSASASADTSPVFELKYRSETLAEGLKSPWSMIELGSGAWLVTERDGHVASVTAQGLTRHDLKLEEIYVAGQGGLLDIVKGPGFDKTGALYLSYAKGTKSANTLAVGSVEFDGA